MSDPLAGALGRRPGPIALIGSGEYLPDMEEIERGLLTGRPPRMVQLATAAAPEGRQRLAYWHDLGRSAAERLGVTQVIVPVVDRVTADDHGLAATVAGAGLVYLSGGDPTFLAATLRGTRVWAAIGAAWHRGAALAGCSAGAMALTGQVPDVRDPLRAPQPGLGVVPHLRVLPHFDQLARFVPASVLRRLTAPARDVTVLGIDERTALVGGPTEWTVQGHRSVWEIAADGRVEHPVGARVRFAAPTIAVDPPR